MGHLAGVLVDMVDDQGFLGPDPQDLPLLIGVVPELFVWVQIGIIRVVDFLPAPP